MERDIRDLVLWALDYIAARGPLKPLGVAIRWMFVYYLELKRDFAFIRASGMAYATLVALVPGLAVILWVLQATGSVDPEGALGMLFDRVFGAVPGLSSQLMGMLSSIDLRALGAVSVIGLLLVASRLYLMVEKAYCDVFGVAVTRRSIGLRMLSFYFSITAVPVVVVLIGRRSIQLAADLGVSGLVDWGALVLEYVVLVAALKLLPATRVRWRPALIGAFVSFVLLEVGRVGFGFYVAWVMGANTISAVYGSLAIFPVFLLWIYLLWLFVLLGVEVAQVSQNYATLVEKEIELSEAGPHWPSADTALRVTAWVGWSFTHGQGPITVAQLADRTGLDARDLNPVLDVLASGGIVVRTEQGWLLSRPAGALSVASVVEAWRERTGVGAHDDPLGTEIGEALALEGTVADGIRRWLPAAAAGPRPEYGVVDKDTTRAAKPGE